MEEPQLWRLNQGARRFLIWTAAGFFPLYALMVAAVLLGGGGLTRIANAMGIYIPSHELTVGLKKKDVALFRVAEPGSTQQITQSHLQTMASIPNVESVYPVAYGNLPARIVVNLFGQGFDTDMVLQGFEPAWLDDLEGELPPWQPGKPIPVVVNRNILSIYNHAYSKSQGLPELSATALKTPLIQLYYGPPGKPPIRATARVTALSSKVALGVAIPREALNWLHQQLEQPEPPILEVVLRVNPKADVDEVREQVTQMGFAIAEPDQLIGLAERLGDLIFSAARPIYLLLGVICALFFAQGFAGVYLGSRERYVNWIEHDGNRRQLWHSQLTELLLTILLWLILATGLGYLLATWTNQSWLTPFLNTLSGSDTPLALAWGSLMKLTIAMTAACFLATLPRLYLTLKSIKEPDTVMGVGL